MFRLGLWLFVGCIATFPVCAAGPIVVASEDYASNASNLSSGTVSVSRLPVGDSATTVAAGNDARFNSIPVGEPSDTVGNSRVKVWFGDE